MVDEPNNSGDIEDCVTFAYWDDMAPNGDGKWWNDDGCSKYHGPELEKCDDGKTIETL